METAIISPKKSTSKKVVKAVPMTKAEMVQKMLADQKAIREAIQNGTSLVTLEKTHGLKFATLPPIKNK
jgi:hypothetical protein